MEAVMTNDGRIYIDEKPQYTIAAYTRPDSPEHSEYLGESVHFAVSCDHGKTYHPLFKNYGMLFPKCGFSKENGIVSHGISKITMYKCGEYYVIAGTEIKRRQVKNGIFMTGYKEKPTEKFVRWLTKDFITFTEPEVHLTKLPGGVIPDCTAIKCFLPEVDAELGVSMEISKEMAENLLSRDKDISFNGREFPEEVTVKSKEELDNVTVKVLYTDGSVHEKRVDWNTDGIDFSVPGKYTVDGKIKCRRFPFPVEERPWGDPIITYYEGKYYFIGTDDREGQKKFEIRRADTPEKLFCEDAERSVILSSQTSEWNSTYWAPEFHIAGGRMCIFCTLGKGSFDPQSYVMRLKEGGDMLSPADWEAPKRCVMPDGRNLCINPLGDGKNGITLDMTYFEVKGRGYEAWSYRTWAGTDSGSMIMIAEADPANPWQLITEPKLLSRPELGWENVNGTDNNEGPHPIVTDDKVYLAYSGGDAAGDTYVIGMITADASADLNDLSSWHKSMIPVLASDFVKGEYGCGHNGFFADEYGDIYITYHGHKTLGVSDRIDGVRRVHFTSEGLPYLYMTDEQDLPKGAENITVTVVVK